MAAPEIADATVVRLLVACQHRGAASSPQAFLMWRELGSPTQQAHKGSSPIVCGSQAIAPRGSFWQEWAWI